MTNERTPLSLPTVLSPFGMRESHDAGGLAPRRASLRGARLGVLHNGKPKAEALLTELAQRLVERYDVADVRIFEKPHFGIPVDDVQGAQMLESCDVALAGVGD